MSSVLVTGGAGFIGSHVAECLLARGHAVTILDDLSGGFEENVPSGARFVRGSVTDHMLVDRLFTEQPVEYVYHLAAYAAEGLSHFIRRFNYINNVIGSVNLINAAVNHRVGGFVFASGGWGFGQRGAVRDHCGFHGFGEVLPEVEPVGDLHRVGCPGAGALGVDAGPVSADDAYSGVSL